MLLESIKNLTAPIILSYLLGFSVNQTALVVLGVFLIDLDHLIYIRYCAGIKSPSKAIRWIKEEHKKLDPHLYLFHTIEFLIVLFAMSILVPKNFLFYIAFGFLINVVIDMIGYIFIYKKLEPWIKYYSLIYYFISKPDSS